jgi:hypothetical protein
MTIASATMFILSSLKRMFDSSSRLRFLNILIIDAKYALKRVYSLYLLALIESSSSTVFSRPSKKVHGGTV